MSDFEKGVKQNDRTTRRIRSCPQILLQTCFISHSAGLLAYVMNAFTCRYFLIATLDNVINGEITHTQCKHVNTQALVLLVMICRLDVMRAFVRVGAYCLGETLPRAGDAYTSMCLCKTQFFCFSEKYSIPSNTWVLFGPILLAK